MVGQTLLIVCLCIFLVPETLKPALKNIQNRKRSYVPFHKNSRNNNNKVTYVLQPKIHGHSAFSDVILELENS